MNSIDKIFKDRLIQKYLSKFSKDDIPNYDEKFKIMKRWYNASAEQYLDRTKETQIQGTFMTQVFESVLGYATVTGTDADVYNQKQEYRSVLDTSEADGGLGFFSKSTSSEEIRVVIELKDARKPLDKKQNRSSHLTPVEQAFSYANKNGSKCGWVIVSNFVGTRLYKSNSSLEYEVFDLRKINEESEFLRFYFILCKDHLINETGKSLIDELYQENEEIGVTISNDFYTTYKDVRNDLYVDLKKLNPDSDSVLLFTKAQKIMDRLTFIRFCESCGLLPQNIYKNLVGSVNNSFSLTPYKLWDELKGLFASIDKGNLQKHINRYNGGLFRVDSELDSLIISDEVLKLFLEFYKYDFGSDLNVNILGHIFEQSIADVEQIKNEINGIASIG